MTFFVAPPRIWQDEGEWEYGRPRTLDITVYEPESEPVAEKSLILGLDGEPIVYRIRSPRQGFVGFIDFRSPEDRDDDEDEDA